ncbi:class I SAM-dependent methyltransferase [Microvirga sp. VF16]|uniref:class I SAM-dependent methyltransferase n=1 Tax=Microvirga sp. VF16 TaxID=2807101 RepID=UPI00193DF007|nr:class I SAM-dependent methyltransferase [Microvirga sp. VF16]QRM30700.1 class I SAM-dependent methyltransferase [Microvirga sp. VF16]
MADWSSGYVVDVEYTYGFYQELTPSLLGFLALLQGVQSPDLASPSLTYCELGCGQGFSTNLLASANPHIQFHATDFNPAHIAGARTLSQSARLGNVHFYDDSFAEFLTRNDLPDFDFITLHGIYSWISPENRRTIVEFIRRKLKPGGIAYISYNCMPGWASTMPLRRLLVEHTVAKGSQLSPRSRASTFLDFAETFNKLDMRFLANNPKLAKRLERLRSQNPNYIVHEYFNTESNPFYFMDLAKELSEAKLTWVGPANALENLDELHLTKEQREFLAGVDNVALRQMTRDHMVDQQFRRDIFIKGPVRLAAHQIRDKWLDTRFALSATGAKIPREVQGMHHTVKLQSAIYDPLIGALDQGSKTLREIVNEPAFSGIGFDRVVQAITFLAALGKCHPCLPDRGFSERKLQTDHFNRAVAAEARIERKYGYFASPVTGGGIASDRMAQLIWLALYEKEADIVRFVDKALAEAGQRLLKDGKPLKGEDHTLELQKRVAEFEQDLLGVWANLGLGAPVAGKAAELRRIRA